MLCPRCSYENRAGTSYCEYCGEELGGARPPTRIEVDPGRKRQTMLEPTSPRPGAPIIPPMPARDPARDPLRSASPRTALDPVDPFRSAVVPASAAPAPHANRARTLLSSPTVPRIRGALLEIRGLDDPGRLHPLRAGRNAIGRDADKDLVLDDPLASGEHAFLFVRGDRLTFTDVSSNGSLVNGSVVHGEQVAVEPGARIQMGEATFLLMMVAEALFEGLG